MKKALVTGVTGQDGSYLAELLLKKGYQVVGMKRRTSIISTTRIDDLLNHPNFKLEYGSMDDTGNFYRLLTNNKFDEVYNLAAQSHVKVSFDLPEEAAQIDAMGPLRLLECIRNISPKTKFYQASSSEMFGDNPTIPQNEETKLQPASPYACSKVFSHFLTRNYRVAYDLHASSGILFNHESPRRGETFVTRKITLGAARIKLGIQSHLELGNLEAKRDWGFAGDYVEAMWLMLQQEIPDDYVVATGDSRSVREFLEETFKLAGLSVSEKMKVNDRLKRPHEVPHLLGDPQKARKKLGWEPKVNFYQLVEMMYEADLKYVRDNEL